MLFRQLYKYTSVGVNRINTMNKENMLVISTLKINGLLKLWSMITL